MLNPRGDRTHFGAVDIAANFVADLQIMAAALTSAYAGRAAGDGLIGQVFLLLSGDALLANVVLVMLLVVRSVSGAKLAR
jgi:hypothetical protein